jgi:hypothetical protein
MMGTCVAAAGVVDDDDDDDDDDDVCYLQPTMIILPLDGAHWTYEFKKAVNK